MFDVIKFINGERSFGLDAYSLENPLLDDDQHDGQLEQRRKAFRRQLAKIQDHPIWQHCHVNKAAILKDLKALDEESWCLMIGVDGLELAFQFYIYSHTLSPEEKAERQKRITEQIERSCLTSDFKHRMQHFFDRWGFLHRTETLERVVRLKLRGIMMLASIPEFMEVRLCYEVMRPQLGDKWRDVALSEYKQRSEVIRKILLPAVRKRIDDYQVLSDLTQKIVVRGGYSYSFDEVEKIAKEIAAIGQQAQPVKGKRGKRGYQKTGNNISLMKRYEEFTAFTRSISGKLPAEMAHQVEQITFAHLPSFIKHSNDTQKMQDIFDSAARQSREEELQSVQQSTAATIKALDRHIFSGALVDQSREALQSLSQRRNKVLKGQEELINRLLSKDQSVSAGVRKMLETSLDDLDGGQKKRRQLMQAAADSAMQDLLEDIAREKREQQASTRKKKRIKKNAGSAEGVPSHPKEDAEAVERPTPETSELTKSLQIAGLKQGILFRLDELKGASDQLDHAYQAHSGTLSQEQSEAFQAHLTEIKNCSKSLSGKAGKLEAGSLSEQEMHDTVTIVRQADGVIADARQLIVQTARTDRAAQVFHTDLMGMLKREELFAGRTDGGRLSFHGLSFADILERYHGYRFKSDQSVVVAGKKRPLNADEALVLYVTFSSRTEGARFCISVGLWTLRLPGDPPADI